MGGVEGGEEEGKIQLLALASPWKWERRGGKGEGGRGEDERGGREEGREVPQSSSPPSQL